MRKNILGRQVAISWHTTFDEGPTLGDYMSDAPHMVGNYSQSL